MADCQTTVAEKDRAQEVADDLVGSCRDLEPEVSDAFRELVEGAHTAMRYLWLVVRATRHY